MASWNAAKQDPTVRTLVVRCTLTEEGRAEDCAVIRSSGDPKQDAVVVGSLTSRSYSPITVGGRPERVSYTFNIVLKTPPDAGTPPPALGDAGAS